MHRLSLTRGQSCTKTAASAQIRGGRSTNHLQLLFHPLGSRRGGTVWRDEKPPKGTFQMQEAQQPPDKRLPQAKTKTGQAPERHSLISTLPCPRERSPSITNQHANLQVLITYLYYWPYIKTNFNTRIERISPASCFNSGVETQVAHT